MCDFCCIMNGYCGALGCSRYPVYRSVAAFCWRYVQLLGERFSDKLEATPLGVYTSVINLQSLASFLIESFYM